MKKVYVVDLTDEERKELLELVGKGEMRARRMNRAHILLLANEGRTDKDIAEALHTSPSTVERTRRRFVEGGLERALNESASRWEAQAYGQAGGVSGGSGLQRSSRGQEVLEHATVGR